MRPAHAKDRQCIDNSYRTAVPLTTHWQPARRAYTCRRMSVFEWGNISFSSTYGCDLLRSYTRYFAELSAQNWKAQVVNAMADLQQLGCLFTGVSVSDA